MCVHDWLPSHGRVARKRAREPFPGRSVTAPSCPGPRSHMTSHTDPTAPTCHILPETLGFGYSESVFRGGLAALV